MHELFNSINSIQSKLPTKESQFAMSMDSNNIKRRGHTSHMGRRGASHDYQAKPLRASLPRKLNRHKFNADNRRS